MKMNVLAVLVMVAAVCAPGGARETGPLPGVPRAAGETPVVEHARYKRLVGVLETAAATIGKIIYDSANTLDSVGLRQPQQYAPAYAPYPAYAPPPYGAPPPGPYGY